MPRVWQTFKTRRDPETGKRVPVLDAKGAPVPHERWRFELRTYEGRRKTMTGTASKRETVKLAARLQAEQDDIRNGYRQAPTQAARAARRPFEEVTGEFLAWGRAQGGLRGGPWSALHAENTATHLRWWQDRLKAETLGDVAGALPRVEQALRELADRFKPKTVKHYQEALRAFCRWCVTRGLLDRDPCAGMTPWRGDVATPRRALTREEVSRLLAVAPYHRRLLYRVALASGLRLGELRSLTRDHLELDPSGLRLDATWTKDRRDGFQPLPRELARELAEYAETGDAGARYAENPSKGSPGPNALLFVPARVALAGDLEAAGIPRDAPGGRVTFHALRHTFVTRLLESGAHATEAQRLARHATLALTVGTYGHATPARLAALAETVGRDLAETGEKAARPGVPIIGLPANPRGEEGAPEARGKRASGDTA